MWCCFALCATREMSPVRARLGVRMPCVLLVGFVDAEGGETINEEEFRGSHEMNEL